MNNESLMNNEISIINQLIHKYKDDDYMKIKLNNYIQNLPLIMSEIEDQHRKKSKQKELLNENKNSFITKFLATHLFFYIPQTEIFIQYDNLNYKLISEDDIIHLIIKTITDNEPTIIHWKFRIKTNIIKQIKDTAIHSTIPESETIQTILNHFYPDIFKTKNHIKYFLTILGDNILNKKETLIYLLDPIYKNFIQTITQNLFMILNKNCTDCFKYKYSDHKYEFCRILEINNSKFDTTFIKNNILNIIAVSCYYSNRYESSDKFLNKCDSDMFVKNVLILKNNTPTMLVNKFLSEFTYNEENSNILFKDFYLLWKRYLKKYNLPLVVNLTYLKSIIYTQNLYDIKSDSCINIKSIHDSNIKNFKQFWTDNITEDENEDNNYEVSELTMIFNDWNKETSICEEEFKEICISYNPNLIIENNKHIHNITCKLWDKTTDIDIAIQNYKSTINTQYTNINAYKYYCKFINKNKDKKYIVSKSYFDKYLNK